MSDQTANVARFLEISAKENPKSCALKIPQKHDEGDNIVYLDLTFEELHSQVSSVASSFDALGVKKGDRVLVMVRPGLELIELIFALFMIGAVPVVIDPGMGLRSFLKCVKRSRPDFLMGIPKAIYVSIVFFQYFGSVNKRIKITPKQIKDTHKAYRDQSFKCTQSNRTDLAAILFTSGSTGAPKGVMYEHGMFDAQLQLIKESYGIMPEEVDMPMLPIFALFNPALGMTTVVPEMDPSKPAEASAKLLVQAIHQNRITNSFGSPVLWWNIGRYCNQCAAHLSSLRRILMAGAPASPRLMRLMRTIAPNAEINSPYGATEALPLTNITAREVLNETWSLTESGKGTCVGLPLKGIDVRVMKITDGPIGNIQDAVILDDGEVGEIIVKGPVVTKEYDALPEATAKAKIYGEGTIWHRMGDTGYVDEKGRLWFCGRVAEMVITPQGPLYTECIEPLFNNHRCVYRSALIGVGEKGMQRAAMVIQPLFEYWPKKKKDEKAFAEVLLKLAQENHLNEIEQIFFLKKLPVDVRHNAKIHRLKLAKQFSSRMA